MTVSLAVLVLAICLAGGCAWLRGPRGKRWQSWLGFLGGLVACGGGASIKYGTRIAILVAGGAGLAYLVATLGRIDRPMVLQSRYDNATTDEERRSAVRGMVSFLAALIAGAIVLFFALGQPGVRN